MANLSSIDQLNNLLTEKDKQTIKKYFEEMDLDLDEIEERISLAEDISVMYIALFVFISALIAVGNELDDEYLKDYLERGYMDVLDRHKYDTEDDYYGDYVDFISDEVIKTTEEQLAKEYYLSNDRAVTIGCNDANAFGNYQEHIEAIKAGYAFKRWETMRDKKVRHTHVMVDGQERPIQSPFKVGNSEMLFPLDESLNAEAKELINCRCVCKYFR